jgi:hypothetical protein
MIPPEGGVGCGATPEASESGWIARLWDGNGTYPRPVAFKVFACTDCTDRFVMLASAWHEVDQAARAAGFKIKLSDATTKVTDDERAAAERHPGQLVHQEWWNDWRGDWEPMTRQ